MKKFTIHTMGCKSNQFEGAVIKQSLESRGYEEVKNIENADFYILNSCSVTHNSDKEALYLLRNAKNKNHNVTNILTGCVAQTEKENLLKYDFIDFIIGNDEKLRLGEILSQHNQTSKTCLVSDIMQQKDYTYTPLKDTLKTRASLKIQDGCDNRCSYCIIPFARGTSRSANEDFIIKQIKNFEKHGLKEIVFTGIHIGLWGKEFGKNLLDLLKAVEKKTDVTRYRLGSLYPNEIDEELLEFLSKSEKFCPHFHLSLQSLCDNTLRSMNRHYTAAESLDIIERINGKFELPFIGCDIITGYAGETDSDFNTTRLNLEKSGLSQIHTFPYSIRQGTAGANAPNQVEDTVKTTRTDIIKAISKEKYKNFINKNLNTTREILIEKHPDKTTGKLKGVTRNYLTVRLNSTDSTLLNTIKSAKITGYNNEIIEAEII